MSKNHFFKNSRIFLIFICYSKHGDEISELIGLYILQGLKQIIPKHIVGIYRDDGVVAMEKGTCKVEVEKI